jgi:spore coat polysaccharide biosynthesis predicted glycosyltransferase SpsG
VPTLVLTHAFNQVAIAEGLAAHGAVLHLGDGAATDEAAIAEALGRLIASPACLAAMSRACRELVDGRGVERVLERMQLA